MLSPRSEGGLQNQVKDPHLSSSCLKPNRRVAYQDEAFRPQQHWYPPNLAACTPETSSSPPSLPSAGVGLPVKCRTPGWLEAQTLLTSP
jgi:hypothetical protein